MTTMNVELTDENNKLLNIVKAMFDLKNKSDALNFVLKEYGKEVIEPQVRPEYMEKLKKLQSGKIRRYSSIEDMRKDFEQQD